MAARAIATGQPICLDSSVLIDYAAPNEPVASLVEPLLIAPDVPVVISVVSVAELVTRPARTGDFALVRSLLDGLLRLPALTIVDFDWDHAVDTARVRAETNLRLPDAAIVATARRADASALLGNDRKWRTRRLGVPLHLVGDILALP
jgi:predicted nucleic acid-binding protein